MKMPKGWGVHAKPVIASKKKKQVTARIDMSPEVAGAGLCPACKQPMTKMVANGVDVLCCMDDRIVLPVQTSE